MNFDIDCLRAFAIVAETMSFSRAAERVRRSQSTISQQITKIEEQVGRSLFVRRKGRVIEITADGRKLLQYADRILRLNDEAYASISEEKLSGVVRLGVPLDFFGRSFTGWIAEFQGLYPRVALEIESDQSENLVRRTRYGEFDVAFFKQGAGLRRGTVVLREQMVWVGGKGAVRPADGPLPLVLFPEGCAYRRFALATLKSFGIPWRITFVSKSYECLTTAVEEGLGVTVLARTLVSPPMRVIGHRIGLPSLPVVDLVYMYGKPGRRGPSRVTAEVANFLADALANARGSERAIAG
jgi:DNA-binding transcriptional LysR family regulator